MSFDAAASARILDAALPQFAERGYESTSLDSIARAAGLARAAVEAQFPTKAALFGLLVERELQRLRTAVLAAVPVDAGGQSTGGAVALALERLLATLREARPSWRLLLHGDFGSFGDRRSTAELRATLRARLTWMLVAALPLPGTERRPVATVLAALLAALVEARAGSPARAESLPSPAEIGVALDLLLGAHGAPL